MLTSLSREQVSSRHPAEFTQLLRKAATQGAMSDALRDETIARLQLGEENGSFTRRLTQDAFSILIVAPQRDEWLPLKRAVCSAIKSNPEVVNGVLALAQQEGFLDAQALHMPRATLPTGRDAALDRLHSIEAALLTYRLEDGTVVSPPYFSVGHDGRSATSHANYSFLERYAFGELRPVDQAHIPNLLYADLDHPQADRNAIVEKMVQEIGGTFRIVEFTNPKGVHFAHAIAKGGSLREPLVGIANSSESDDPAGQATKRLLRLDAFKDALTFPHLEELRNAVRPMERLQQQLNLHGLSMRETTEPATRSGRSRFHTTIMVTQDGQEKEYTGTGPNMDRARHDAASKVLKEHGWWDEKGSVAPAKSWMEETLSGATSPLLTGR